MMNGSKTLRDQLDMLELEAAEIQREARKVGDFRTALAAVRERREIAIAVDRMGGGETDAEFAAEALAEFNRLKAEDLE